MTLREARRVCPDITVVPGDSEKYLSTTKRFLSILKDYSPHLEVFSIDECFLELPGSTSCSAGGDMPPVSGGEFTKAALIAQAIKQRLKHEVGEWITCSIGISYNKPIAKLAGSLYKPNGLAVIADEESAMMVLDQLPLDEICGIGLRLKWRLNNLGIFDFKTLRQIPKEYLTASFKQYGEFLYLICRGIDHSETTRFYEKEEVKSIGHRHTIDHDTRDEAEIKQILLKISELVSRRLRAKRLVGKTIHGYFRHAFNSSAYLPGHLFDEESRQVTVDYTDDGLEIFNAAWTIFQKVWDRDKMRMVGVTVANLKPACPENLRLLAGDRRVKAIHSAIDLVNDKFGEFTLKRGTLLNSVKVYRKPNPYLSDRRLRFQ